MVTFQEMRELFYPLGWILRFLIITLLCLVLMHLTEIPENYNMLVFVYQALIVGMVIIFAIQFWNIWVFWKDRKEEQSKI